MPNILPELNEKKGVHAKATRTANSLTEILNDATSDRPKNIYQLKTSLGDFPKTLERLEDIGNRIYIDRLLDTDAPINDTEQPETE